MPKKSGKPWPGPEMSLRPTAGPCKIVPSYPPRYLSVWQQESSQYLREPLPMKICQTPADTDQDMVNARFIVTAYDTAASLEAEGYNSAKTIAALPKILGVLSYLLEQTVDQDLKHGIGLTEGEVDARKKALEIFSQISRVKE